MIEHKDFVPEVEWFPNLFFFLSSVPHIVEDRYSVRKRMQDWIMSQSIKIINIETLDFEYGKRLIAKESRFRVWYEIN